MVNQREVRVDTSDFTIAMRAAIVGQRLVPRAGDGGRVAVLEVMAESGFYGMQTFDQHLIALYRDGVIEFEDALGVATNPHDLQVALRSQGLVA
jgi:twitching motility protein PilT